MKSRWRTGHAAGGGRVARRMGRAGWLGATVFALHGAGVYGIAGTGVFGAVAVLVTDTYAARATATASAPAASGAASRGVIGAASRGVMGAASHGVMGAASRGVIGAASAVSPATGARAVRVGSKNFTEGYVLAELFARVLERAGLPVERKFGLGGTLVCYRALVEGEIDVYPEYTGTLSRVILRLSDSPALSTLGDTLRRRTSLDMLPPLGFNNTYAMAMARTAAESLGVSTVGDLAGHPRLRLAFSHEFVSREDGWPGLAKTYALGHTPRGIEHGLAYRAIAEGRIDVTDVYSTDGDIDRYHLVVLEDDAGYFPTYLAIPLVRADLGERARRALAGLSGRIDETAMRAMNADVLIGNRSFAQAAGDFLDAAGVGVGGVEPGSRDDGHRATVGPESLAHRVGRRAARHLVLTGVALAGAVVLAIPLGVWGWRSRRARRPVLYLAGILQTIPSIALLAFMIPLFGIGVKPAFVALFLYSLLPVLRNTVAALDSVDPVLRSVATAMGLTGYQRLRHVEFPLAAPTILAGVRTAAVINIGTATLAAFIGAGGLGEPIVTGLALNDTGRILEGALPAAILAIVMELLFEGLDRILVPSHLRRSPAKM